MATVLLDIVDNAEVEPDESLVLQMEVSEDLANKGVSIKRNGQSMVTIQDNDGKYTHSHVASICLRPCGMQASSVQLVGMVRMCVAYLLLQWQ